MLGSCIKELASSTPGQLLHVLQRTSRGKHKLIPPRASHLAQAVMSSAPVLMELRRVHTRNPRSPRPAVRPTQREFRCHGSTNKYATCLRSLSQGSDSCNRQIDKSLTRKQVLLGVALSLGTVSFGGDSHAYELSCQGLKAYDMQKCLRARREAQEAEVRRNVDPDVPTVRSTHSTTGAKL